MFKKPEINKTDESYHASYMAMFDKVRFATTKEVVDHIMYQADLVKSQKAEISRVWDLVGKLEQDIEKECFHSSRITKTLEEITKKSDRLTVLMQSIYGIILLEEGQSKHPIHKLKKQIQDVLESGDF